VPLHQTGEAAENTRTRSEEATIHSRSLAHYSVGGYTIDIKVRNLSMSHTIRAKTKLLNRVRRIRGQVEAIERALEAEAGCANVLQRITSCRGAINGLLGEVLEDHVRTHFSSTPANVEASEQLLDVVHSYFK
jgi:FrmR/RcnR family transcriptional regulator, repressor of frmRAB operon